MASTSRPCRTGPGTGCSSRATRPARARGSSALSERRTDGPPSASSWPRPSCAASSSRLTERDLGQAPAPLLRPAGGRIVTEFANSRRCRMGRAGAQVTDLDVAKGIKQVDDGDYDAAILTLDTAARHLATDPAKSRDLSQ